MAFTVSLPPETDTPFPPVLYLACLSAKLLAGADSLIENLNLWDCIHYSPPQVQCSVLLRTSCVLESGLDPASDPALADPLLLESRFLWEPRLYLHLTVRSAAWMDILQDVISSRSF